MLEDHGVSVEELIAQQRALHPGQDEAYLLEEVVANTVPVILTDAQTGIELAERVAGESEKTRSAFLRLLDKIGAMLKKAYTILKGQDSWKQMRALEGDIMGIANIREAYFRALDGMRGVESQAGGPPRFSETDDNIGLLDRFSEERVAQLQKNEDAIFVNTSRELDEHVKSALNTTKQLPVELGVLPKDTVDRVNAEIHNKPSAIQGDILYAHRQYAVELNYDSIRHMAKHGFSEQQIIAYARNIPNIVTQFDDVYYSPYEHHGTVQIGLRFSKTFQDGRHIVYELVSKKRNVLSLQTYVIDQQDIKKKPVYSAKSQMRSGYTSETPSTLASEQSVPQADTSVNISIREDGGSDTENSSRGEGPPVIRYSAKDGNTLSIKEQIKGHQGALNALEPVANIKSGGWAGLTKAQQLKKLVDAFGTFGTKIERQGFGEIVLDEKRINNGFNYINSEAEYAAFFAVPYVLKRGINASGHINHKGRGYDTVTFAAPVVINGVRGNMAVSVKKETKNYYKMHRILMPDGSVFEFKAGQKETEPTTGVGGNKTVASPIGPASDNTVSLDDTDVNISIRNGEEIDAPKFSVKDFGPERFTYDALIKRPDMYVPEMTRGVPVDAVGKVDRRNLLDQAIEAIRKENNPKNHGTEVFVLNADTRRDIGVSASALRHGLDRRTNTNAPAVLHVNEILKNAIMLNTLSPRIESASDSYVLLGIGKLQMGGNTDYYVVRFIINRFGTRFELDSIDSIDRLHALTAKKESAAYYRQSFGKNPLSLSDSSTIKIAYFLEIVKNNFPEILPNDVLKHLKMERTAGVFSEALRFSLKDTDPVNVDQLKKENEKLAGALALAVQEFQITKGHHVSNTAIHKMAARILKDASSTYDRTRLQDNLRTMFDYIANAEQPVWDEIEAMGVGMAESILMQSRQIDKTLYEEYAEARAYLRETPIVLNDEQRAEAASAFDGYRTYRQALFGRVKLSNNGVPLDKAWQELSGRYPQLFDPDTNPNDMSLALMDAADALRPQYVNPYGYNMREAAYDLFLQVYDDYFSLPEVHTFADKQAAKLMQLKVKMRNQIADIRKSSLERYNERLKALRAEYQQKRSDTLRQYNEAKRLQHSEDMKRFEARYARLADMKNDALMKQRAHYEQRMKEDRARRQERETVAKYRARIDRNVKDLYLWMAHPTDAKHVPEHMRLLVGDFLESIDMAGNKHTKKAQQWREMFLGLKDAMQRMDGDKDYSGYFTDFDPDIVPRLEEFVSANRTVETVHEMNADQLKELDFLVGVIKHAITDSNKLHANGLYQQLADIGNKTIEELHAKKARKAYGRLMDMTVNLLNLGQLDAFSYFDQLEPAAQSILKELRDGFDVKVRDIKQAEEYMKGVLKNIVAEEVSGPKAKTHTFRVKGGELTLTTAQIMELYLLDQREQARGHIYGGGIKPAETIVRVGKKVVKLVAHEPVVVSPEDVQKMIEVVTPQQVAVADAMQRFIGDEAAEWGNEASMRMYRYRKFTEAYYWPIKTDENYVRTQDPSSTSGLYALRNLGMTKATVKNAGNPIILDDVFETFSRHVDEMASYHGLATPLGDAMKWFNYRDADVGTVKQSIARVLGNGGKSYFVNLVKDINGSASEPYSIGMADALLRNTKMASVAANLSVIVQQPIAYLRAAAEIDMKYLVAAMAHKPRVKLAQKYAPIAQWKAWGFYDVNVGKSMREIIVGGENLLVKARRWSLAGAQVADNLTWGTLWNACAAETKAEHPELKPGTEEFNEAVGARLSYVVDRTQVVDSVFHRSQLMRSKSGLTKLYTAFMAEPTKTYNMLRNAIVGVAEHKAGSGKKLARVGVAFVLSQVVNAAVRSLVRAMRDDDEEETFGQKYMQSLIGAGESWQDVVGSDIVSNLNPLNLIPFARDLMSIVQGYSPSRLDIQAVEDLWTTAEQWIKFFGTDSTWSTYKLIYKTVQSLSKITGIPLGNVMQELNSYVNTIAPGAIDMESETASAAKSYETLYEAILSGDTAKVERIRALLALDEESPKSPRDIDVGIAGVLMRDDPRIAEAYRARAGGDISELRGIMKQIMADGFSMEVVTYAINQYENSLPGKEEKDMGEELDAELYDYDDLYAAIRGGNNSEMLDVYSEMLGDSDAEDPEKAIRDQVTEEFKEEYVGYVEAGDTASAAALAEKLRLFGVTDEKMGGWVKDYQSEVMRTAVADMNVDATNEYIGKLQTSGRTDTSIKNTVTKLMKARVIELYEKGDTTGIQRVIDFLVLLELYNTDEDDDRYGYSYYYSDMVWGWVDDYLEDAG